MNEFKNHVATLVANSDTLAVIDWKDIKTIGFDESYDLGNYLDHIEN